MFCYAQHGSAKKIYYEDLAIRFFILLFILFASLTPKALALSFGNGTYTNLCGTGFSATSDTCNRGCNTGSGSCSSSGSNVVKWTCDGRQTACQNSESSFSTTQSLSGVACGKTVQIDVFDATCRVNGNWVCGDRDHLQDYIVWYSGDCQATPVCSQVSIVDESGRNFTWPAGTAINWYAASSDGLTNVSASVTGATSTVQRLPFVTNNFWWNYQSTTGSNPGTFTVSFQGFKGSLLCSASHQFTIPAAPSVTPTQTPTPTLTPSHTSSCDALSIVSGNNSLVPATVTLRARGSDSTGNIQMYRFFWGDGHFDETTNSDLSHRYEVSGSFLARAEIKDSQGAWKSSGQCETTVTVQPVAIESQKSDCSDLFINEGNYIQAPTTAKFTVTGYDNKGSLKRYKMDFGDGTTNEKGDSNNFEHRYDRAGTYTTRGYVLDSRDNWKGGTGSCEKALYINTAPLTKQPSTGTPTAFTLLALTGGLWVFSLFFVKVFWLS